MRKILLALTIVLQTQHSLANSQQDAINKAAEAAYIQSGVRDNVDHLYRDVERRYIPIFIVDNGGIIMFLVQNFNKDEVKISYKWSY